MVSPQIRVAEVHDARDLAVLHRDTVTVAYAGIFPPDADPPSVDELEVGYRALLLNEASVTYVANGFNDSVIGAIAVVVDAQVPAGRRIERFNVHPSGQGRGVGAALYRRAIEMVRSDGASSLNLWVLDGNAHARQIYEAWGWRLVPGRTLENDPPEVLDVLYALNLSDVSE